MDEKMKTWASEHENGIRKIYGKAPITNLEYKYLMLELIRNGFSPWIVELRKRSGSIYENYEEFMADPNPFPYLKWTDWKARYPSYYMQIKGLYPVSRLDYFNITCQLKEYGFYRQLELIEKQF